MRAGISSINNTNIIDLAWWLQRTSNPIVDTIRLLQFNGNSFFPLNFPYKNLLYFKGLLIGLTFLPVLMIVCSFWQKKSKKYNPEIYWTFIGLFSAFILLTARIRFPFEKINNLLFQIPGFSVLRGYEKFAIFTPFIMAVLLLFFLLYSKGKNYYKFAIIVFIIILFTPVPFYVGRLQQNTSFILAGEKNKDYRKAKYSFLVKIPKEYYKIQKLINEDKNDFKIATLPYNVIGSIGWVNYPKWQLQASDVTEQLYNKKFINANGFYFEQWLYAKDFNELDLDPLWVVKLLGSMNVKYILYHKDVDKQFIKMSFDKIKFLERQKVIKNITENPFFILYKVDKFYTAPYVDWESEKVMVKKNPLSIGDSFDELKKITNKAYYRVVNSTKIIVNVKDNHNRYLVLNEKHNDGWQAYWISIHQKNLQYLMDFF